MRPTLISSDQLLTLMGFDILTMSPTAKSRAAQRIARKGSLTRYEIPGTRAFRYDRKEAEAMIVNSALKPAA